ncbi:MAG: ABC transporter permease [Clostridiales bacterium]|jgi:putative ABC transport system permease protein|nr:ABC transporter permease [Clostridiales bacterium]
MKNKIFDIVKQADRNIWKNKPRAYLIILGIGIAIACLIVGFFIRETIIHVNYKAFNNTSDNVVMIEVSGSDSEKLITVLDNYQECRYNLFGRKTSGNVSFSGVNIKIAINTVANFSEVMTFPSREFIGATQNTRLVRGRLLNQADKIGSENNILINEGYAEFLFGSGESIGRTLTVSNIKYTIVGILSETDDVKRNIYAIDNVIKNRLDRAIEIEIYTVYNAQETELIALAIFGHTASTETLNKIKGDLKDAGVLFPFVTCRAEQERYLEAIGEQSTKTTNIIVNVIMIVMCLVAVTLMYFSLRDRTKEIALRKSFGATDFELIAFMMFEISLIILISALIFVPIGFFVGLIVQIQMLSPIGGYLIAFNLSNAVLSVLIVSLVTLSLSLVPILLAIKSKIADVLRFN